MRTIFSFVILLLVNGVVISQNETTKWYFGNNAGLDFSTNPTTLLNNSSMHVSEGCSSVSDASGNLLFYTDGDTIWNKNHMLMANGTGLFGNGSSSQSCIIVKQPGSASIYYVFTVQGGGGSAGVNYSMVDMTLAAGMGSVTVKNSQISGPREEKITAIKHCNGKDYWIVTTFNNFNQTYFQVFSSYLLSSTGVNTLAATSIATLQGGFSSALKGSLKGSPDAKHLGLATSFANGKSFFLMDFDNSTGQISNPVALGYGSGYGCEFSPDSKKVYASFPGAVWQVVQWDLAIQSNSAVVASQTVVNTSFYVGAMQLARDGKIYIATNQSSLAVINSPNANWSVNNLSLTPSFSLATPIKGLPNFPADYFWNGYSLNITTSNSLTLCKGQTRTLTVTGATSYTWNGGAMTSTLAISPTVTTNYSVTATTTAGCLYKGAVTVTVSDCTGLDHFTQDKLSIIVFPNPANEYLQFEFLNMEGETFTSVSIYDQFGKLAFEQKLELSKEYQIKLTDLPVGVYSLVFKSNSLKTIVKKLAIAR